MALALVTPGLSSERFNTPDPSPPADVIPEFLGEQCVVVATQLCSRRINRWWRPGNLDGLCCRTRCKRKVASARSVQDHINLLAEGLEPLHLRCDSVCAYGQVVETVFTRTVGFGGRYHARGDIRRGDIRAHHNRSLRVEHGADNVAVDGLAKGNAGAQ